VWALVYPPSILPNLRYTNICCGEEETKRERERECVCVCVRVWARVHQRCILCIRSRCIRSSFKDILMYLCYTDTSVYIQYPNIHTFVYTHSTPTYTHLCTSNTRTYLCTSSTLTQTHLCTSSTQTHLCISIP